MVNEEENEFTPPKITMFDGTLVVLLARAYLDGFRQERDRLYPHIGQNLRAEIYAGGVVSDLKKETKIEKGEQ